MTCETCGEQLTQTQARFCSHDCHMAWKRIPPLPCARCGVVFVPGRSGRRFCSMACANRQTGDARRIDPTAITCRMCGGMFLSRRRRRVICSEACNLRDAPILTELLALLRAAAYTWMTTSDLALWIYGFDDENETHAIRMHLMRLRRRGHRITSRRATWEITRRGSVRAYQLVSSPVVAQEAA